MTWRETDDEIEVSCSPPSGPTVPHPVNLHRCRSTSPLSLPQVQINLPSEVQSKADLDVQIGASSLQVLVRGQRWLGGALCGRLRTDDCSWFFVPAADESGALPQLQLDLMKRPSEQLWGYIFVDERDAARD